jgi:predicted glutamine amidotransferase
MARLLGFLANRPDLGARVVLGEGSVLDVRRPAGVSAGWGVGFHQAGDVLLRRRPVDDRTEIRMAELVRELHADMLIAHVRAATVGTLRTENTHPFRYRQWLFAHCGTIEAFDSLRPRISDTLPVFLQRDVRGDTDSELIFHLFLSFLHDAGQLDRPQVEPADVRAALRSTKSLVDGLLAEEGHAPSAMNMLLGTSEYLVAVRAGAPMAWRALRGKTDLERYFGEGGPSRLRVQDLASCSCSLVASDFDDDVLPAGWTPVPDRSIVTITRSDAPAIESL